MFNHGLMQLGADAMRAIGEEAGFGQEVDATEAGYLDESALSRHRESFEISANPFFEDEDAVDAVDHKYVSLKKATKGGLSRLRDVEATHPL